MQTSFTSEQIKKMICEKLTDNLAVSPENAPDELFYKASALVVRDILVNKRRQFKAAHQRRPLFTRSSNKPLLNLIHFNSIDEFHKSSS